jgi:hypothetical protein
MKVLQSLRMILVGKSIGNYDGLICKTSLFEGHSNQTTKSIGVQQYVVIHRSSSRAVHQSPETRNPAPIVRPIHYVYYSLDSTRNGALLSPLKRATLTNRPVLGCLKQRVITFTGYRHIVLSVALNTGYNALLSLFFFPCRIIAFYSTFTHLAYRF